jgi:hypothetical protein
MKERIKRLLDRIASTREQIEDQERSMAEYPEYPSASLGLASLRRRLAQLEAEWAEMKSTARSTADSVAKERVV